MNKQAYESSVRRVLDKQASDEPTMTRQQFMSLAQARDRTDNVKNLLLNPGNTTLPKRIWGNPATNFDAQIRAAMRGSNYDKYLKKPVIYAGDAWSLVANPKYKPGALQHMAEEAKNPEDTRREIPQSIPPYLRASDRSNLGPQNIKDYE